MALIYRAIWSDSDHVALAVLDDEFARWCRSKSIKRDQIPLRGVEQIGPREIEVRRADTEVGAVLRTRLTEPDPAGRIWRITATALSEPGPDAPSYWIEVDCDDPTGSPTPLAAPRLARQILDLGGSPCRGPVALSAVPQVILDGYAASRVAELVFDPDRDIPLVVFSPDVRATPEVNHQRALSAAKRLAGIAAVHLLSPAAIESFNSEMPDGFRVYGGAVRHYLPGVRPDDDADSVRHRWYGPKMFNRTIERAGELVARRLAAIQQWPEEPESWSRLRPLISRPTDAEVAVRAAGIAEQLSAPGPDVGGLQAELEEAINLLVMAEADRDAQAMNAAAEIDRLRRQIAGLDAELTDAVDAQEDLQAQVLAQAFMLRSALRGTDPRAPEVQADAGELPVPDGVDEAIELAQAHLGLVVIPDAALRDIDVLDQNLKYKAWAGAIWQGLLALEHYAIAVSQGRSSGGFYNWCSQSGEWATGKIAMGESETVENNARWKAARILPIDPAVGLGEKTYMGAHLKIQKGGETQIPRIYFHDDTGGATGKVHVGFIGPHSLMPNKQTN